MRSFFTCLFFLAFSSHLHGADRPLADAPSRTIGTIASGEGWLTFVANDGQVVISAEIAKRYLAIVNDLMIDDLDARPSIALHTVSHDCTMLDIAILMQWLVDFDSNPATAIVPQLTRASIKIACFMELNKHKNAWDAFLPSLAAFVLDTANLSFASENIYTIYLFAIAANPVKAYAFKDALDQAVANKQLDSGKAFQSAFKDTTLSLKNSLVLHTQGRAIQQASIRVTADEIAEYSRRRDVENIFTSNPTLTLILDYEDKTAIHMPLFLVPNSVFKLAIEGSQISTIGDHFLYGCKNLRSLDLSALSKVTAIGDDFLIHCNSLSSLDLTALSKVTAIGDDFLYACTSLSSLDLSALSKVTVIGGNFLAACTSLSSLDLTALSKLTVIGKSFLSGSNRLASLDLSALSEVSTIGDYFLTCCDSLRSLDLSALSKVTTVGQGFLFSDARVFALNLTLPADPTAREFLQGKLKGVHWQSFFSAYRPAKQ